MYNSDGCLDVTWYILFRRGLNPPHRLKSINMSTFTQDEVEFMKCRGNQVGLGYFNLKKLELFYYLVK
jgi:hypothetical protein